MQLLPSKFHAVVRNATSAERFLKPFGAGFFLTCLEYPGLILQENPDETLSCSCLLESYEQVFNDITAHGKTIDDERHIPG
jgi:hypothetical protein